MSINLQHISEPGPTPLAVPALRLSDVDERAARFIDSRILDWFIQEVYDPVISLGVSRGLAQRYLDAIQVIKPGFLNVQLVSDPIEIIKGKRLFDMLEEGWGNGGYDIESKNPDEYWLHWTGGKYGPGDHYAPKVRHPGFKGYHFFDSVKNWGFVDRFLNRIAKETQEYLESVRFT